MCLISKSTLITFATAGRINNLLHQEAVPLQVIPKLSYNRPKRFKNFVVPDCSVMSFTIPVAASVTNIVSPTVQIPCGWTKVQFFTVQSSFPLWPLPSWIVTTLSTGLYTLTWWALNSVKAKEFLKGSTRLISEQEFVSFFNTVSNGPPSKLN